MNAAHQFPIRIYYEDTDHGGVVYHANYLKYMERGRTELLRSLGIELSELEAAENIVFAVTDAHIHFHQPAKFNDALWVHTNILKNSGVRLYFQQKITHQHANNKPVLISAEITVACLTREGKVSRIPKHLALMHTDKQSLKGQ